jgi:hypothetical protein
MISKQNLQEVIRSNIGTIILFVILFILFLIPESFQFQNRIANAIVFAPRPFYAFLILYLSLNKLRKRPTNKGTTYLLKFAKVVAILPLALYTLYYTISIFDSTMIKSPPVLKIIEKNNYSYIAETSRRFALDDLYVLCYKEKTIGPIFKIKQHVLLGELSKLGVDTIALRQKYGEHYHQWAKSNK